MLKLFNKVLCAMLAWMMLLSAAIPAAAVTLPEETTVPAEAAEQAVQPPEETVSETAAETIPEILPEEPAEPEQMDVEQIPSLEDLSEREDADTYRSVPLYFQTDYTQNMYGSGTIADNGCGVTCLAMVATYLTDHEYLPDELARYFGGAAENNIDRLEKGATAMQLPWKKMENFHKTIEALGEGKVIIALMESDSLFTDKQHFVVLTGYNENGLIMVHDPFEPNYEKWDLKRAFQEGFTEGDICRGFSGGWAFDKSVMPEEAFLYYEESLGDQTRYPQVKLSSEDVQLLARVVWVEARGESKEGQQAVAEVVLNRLASEDFPNTMRGVIYAEGQFRSVPYLEDAEPYQAQYEAIDRALHGPYVLPEGVVHFATFRTNDNVWGQIGGHIFCYQG